MGQLKEFVYDTRGYVFVSDSRDIAVAYTERSNVWAWAHDNGIDVEYQGSMSGTDVWRVKDNEQRAWFLLRWGQQ